MRSLEVSGAELRDKLKISSRDAAKMKEVQASLEELRSGKKALEEKLKSSYLSRAELENKLGNQAPPRQNSGISLRRRTKG